MLNSDVLESLGAHIYHMEAQDTTERQNRADPHQILNGGASTEFNDDLYNAGLTIMSPH